MTASGLDARQWARLEELFHDAVDLPQDRRMALLRQLEREDADLWQELTALLRAHERPGPLATLDSPPAAAPAGKIGPYRLFELIGVGGMGVVYRAEREGPDFTQRVALKLIRAGYADYHLEERLRRERRILARLEHPGIARFIDGGTTETGQSFFAMEYIEGTSLLDYCAAHRLGVRDRVRLLIEICEALHHAHQQLVVHGDLKPGNILVTPEGRPKLLDFGIAELMDVAGASDGRPRTAPWFTPEYASPEQVRGERLTAPADIYSLGVLLYELLAGRRPYEMGRTPGERERIVAEREPPRPSAVVEEPPHRRELKGDLDTIVLKAMAKEPSRRYGSAEQLAADLGRYLAGRPVLARPDTAGYRLAKLVRRHRALAGAALLLFLSLVGGLAMVTWQAAVARRQRDAAAAAQRQAEEVSAFLIDLFESSDPRLSGLDTLSVNTLLRQGLDRVEGLDNQPVLQARVLDALARVQMGMRRYDDALTLHRRALALRQAHLGERHPDVALSYTGLAMAHRQRSEMAPAESLIALAIAIEREQLDPKDPQLARTLLAAVNIAVASARLDQSERYSREALEIIRVSLPAEDPLQSEATRVLGSVLVRRGRIAESEAIYQEMVALNRRTHGPDHPATGSAMIHLGDFYREQLGRRAEAESLYRAALGMLGRAWGEDHPGLIHGRGSLADLLSQRGVQAPAESLLRANLRTLMRTMGSESSPVAEGLGALSDALRRQGRVDEAAELAEQALSLHRRTTRPDDPAVAGSMHALAWARVEQGRGEEALALAREALALRRRSISEPHPLIARAYEMLARIYLSLKQAAVAETLLGRSLTMLDQLPGRNRADYERIERLLAELRQPAPREH